VSWFVGESSGQITPASTIGFVVSDSGAGTNFKVGEHRSGAKVGGAPIRHEAPEKMLVVPLHILALKAQLVVLVSAFLMVSTVRSVSCLLFFYSRCPPRAQPFVKVGTRAPRVPWSRRHWFRNSFSVVTIYFSLFYCHSLTFLQLR